MKSLTMSTLIRILPQFLTNVISRRRIESPLEKLKYMIFRFSKGLYYDDSKKAEFICSNEQKEIAACQIVTVQWDEASISVKNVFLNLKQKIWLEIINIQRFTKEKSICQLNQVTHVPNNSELSKLRSAKLHNRQIKTPPFDANNPFLAQIVTNKELHKGGNRSCLHLEFDISNSQMDYEAGDYVAVYPKNDSYLVERLGELTNTDLSEDLSLPNKGKQTTSYYTVLSHYTEITARPTTEVIKTLAEYCGKEEDKNKMLLMSSSSEKGKSLYQSFVKDASRNIVHILEDIKSCRPSLGLICSLLPRLQPRYYSISSSPKLFPESVHVTAVVVKYKTKSGRVHQGVTTSWLSGRKPGQGELPRVPIYIRKSEFRLPTSAQIPIIMVGTGTGLAPFRGFLQERAHAQWKGEKVGDTILYFGCRHKHQDFIYQTELEEYERRGLLKLNLAFSRDQEHKVYVTHLLEKNLEQIWDVLGNRNGHFYVCGNANNMAVDVKNIVLRAIKEVGGKSDEVADKFLNNLESTQKYNSDAWS